jgi:hypothetical protein
MVTETGFRTDRCPTAGCGHSDVAHHDDGCTVAGCRCAFTYPQMVTAAVERTLGQATRMLTSLVELVAAATTIVMLPDDGTLDLLRGKAAGLADGPVAELHNLLAGELEIRACTRGTR